MSTDPPLAETLVSPPGSPRPQLRPQFAPPVPPSRSADRVFEEATRDLLHKRLLLCAWICNVGSFLLLAVVLVSGGRGAPNVTFGLFATVLFCAFGVLALLLL